MEIHKHTNFLSSSHTITECQSVPHYKPWTDVLYQPSDGYTRDGINQMQLLRFPTPPITPPKQHFVSHTCVAADSDCVSEKSIRTQSVIMKVGHGQHIMQPITANEIGNINSINKSKHDSHTSDSASPSSDYVCEWKDCGRFFESLESLAVHVTQTHAVSSPRDGLYYCRWMGCLRTDRGFNARYKMLVHVRTHTKEKPHQCDICEKSFSRAENLKIHMRSHSGEKPYVCTFPGCNKAYSNSSDRFKHTRTHSMEKPYKCKVPGCNKRYTDPSSLRKHVKTFKHSNIQQSLEISANCGSSGNNNTVIHSLYSESSSSNYGNYNKDDDTRPTFLYTPPHVAHSISAPAVGSSVNADAVVDVAGAAHVTHYYMNDIYHKDSSNTLNYMFIKDTPAYWLSSTSECPRNYSLDLDIDMPLDLRVNRS